MLTSLFLSWATAASSAQQAAPEGWWADVANDQVSSIEGMLLNGADPNAVNQQGDPSIMLAVRRKAWGVFDALAADPQTNVNITNSADETPLMYLAITGQTARAQALIRRGAHVNRLGWTPLHYAASMGKVDTARMLLANKAIVNAPSPDGTTPLMMAAFSGSDAMVQLLLDAGADVTTRNLKGQSAADWARHKGFGDLAGKLDALADKVQARRRAQREKDLANQAHAIPVPAPGGEGLEAPREAPASPEPPPLPNAAAPGAAPAGQTPPSGASGNAAGQGGNGTSQYFNLGGPTQNAGH